MNENITPFTYEEYLTDNPDEKPTEIRNLELNGSVGKFYIREVGSGPVATLRAKVRECVGQSLVVGGIPANFSPKWVTLLNWSIGGTDIRIMDYIGTYACGVLYLSKSVNIKVGQYINVIGD